MDIPPTFPAPMDHPTDGMRMAVQPGQADDPARTFQTLVEQANDAMVVLQDGKAVYRNPALPKMLGHTLEEAQANASRSFFDFVAPEDQERARAYQQKHLRGEP